MEIQRNHPFVIIGKNLTFVLKSRLAYIITYLIPTSVCDHQPNLDHHHLSSRLMLPPLPFNSPFFW